MTDSPRKVLITGGTGSIGSSLVTAFAQNDYDVTFQYHSRPTIADQLMQATGAKSWQCDFLAGLQLPQTDFDIVINSAGVLLTKTLTHDIDDEEYRTTLEINLVIPFQIARACLPHMISKSWGRIINIGSIYSLRGAKRNASYNASKHGLSGLTKSIALDYADVGITCNEICPAAVESEIMTQLATRKEAEGGITAHEFLRQVRAANPAGRMADPSDIVAAALFLASDNASFINGVSLPIDGGATA